MTGTAYVFAQVEHNVTISLLEKEIAYLKETLAFYQRLAVSVRQTHTGEWKETLT